MNIYAKKTDILGQKFVRQKTFQKSSRKKFKAFLMDVSEKLLNWLV